LTTTSRATRLTPPRFPGGRPASTPNRPTESNWHESS
jgi:hypothetical protein